MQRFAILLSVLIGVAFCDTAGAYYHAQLGRFVSRDPIGYRGSPFNLYEYVKGRPSGSLDPSGLGVVVCHCECRRFRWTISRPDTTINTGGRAHNAPVNEQCEQACDARSSWSQHCFSISWDIAGAKPSRQQIPAQAAGEVLEDRSFGIEFSVGSFGTRTCGGAFHFEVDYGVFFNPFTGEWASSADVQFPAGGIGSGYGGGIEITAATGSPHDLTHGDYLYGEVELPKSPNWKVPGSVGYEHGLDPTDPYSAGTIGWNVGNDIGIHGGLGQDIPGTQAGGNVYDSIYNGASAVWNGVSDFWGGLTTWGM